VHISTGNEKYSLFCTNAHSFEVYMLIVTQRVRCMKCMILMKCPLVLKHESAVKGIDFPTTKQHNWSTFYFKRI